ncbi:hypothetical protein KUCAC02_000390, partial [Chaenocephalus aceratus]
AAQLHGAGAAGAGPPRDRRTPPPSQKELQQVRSDRHHGHRDGSQGGVQHALGREEGLLTLELRKKGTPH